MCDADEVTGCKQTSACNYDDRSTTNTDNSLCVYADAAQCQSCSGETDGSGTIVNGNVVEEGGGAVAGGGSNQY